jgi:alanyl aminopeptidase
LTALGEGAGKDVKAAFSTFLDQPGVPIVTPALACDAAGARLSLSQERFLPIGSKGTAAGASWKIPVCVRYGEGKETGRACGLLEGQKGELALPPLAGKKSGCPDWVMPNADGTGYYRSAYSTKDFGALLGKGGKKLTVAERMNAVLDLRALASNARFPVGEALSRLPDLMKDPSGHVQAAAVEMVGLVTDDFVEADLRPNARRFVNKLVGPKLKSLGWQAKAADSSATRTLRSRLLHAVMEMGDDPKVFAEPLALADAWLRGAGGVEPGSVEAVLRGAASRGDRALFDKMVAALKAEKDSRRREQLFGALAAFREPALARAAMELYLDEGIDAREAMGLLWFQPRYNRAVLWAFVKERFDALMARLPEGARAYLLNTAEGLCDEAGRADAESFLKERAPKVPGGPRLAAQALESISLCIAKREAYKESLRAFLKKQ